MKNYTNSEVQHDANARRTSISVNIHNSGGNMGLKEFFGRFAKTNLDNKGLMMLCCGYPESRPLPEFGYGNRRVVVDPPNIPSRDLTETELNQHIANWTSLFHGWPVPLDALPLGYSRVQDGPYGGIGILATTLLGVAAHESGPNGKLFMLRMPSDLVIPVAPWSLSSVEALYVILHQVPPECIMSESRSDVVSGFSAIAPYGHLGMPGQVAKASPPENIARFYREATRHVCLRYRSMVETSVDDDSRFLEYLEQRYQEEKEHLACLLQDGMPKEQEPLARLGLLILAVGLFSYGHLDVVEDILDSVPPQYLRVGRLAWSLNGMLPLPASIGDAQLVPERVREWFRQYRDSLVWSEDQGLFKLQ